MDNPPSLQDAAIAQAVTAPQHGPRPLPLFLDLLWRRTQDQPDLRRRAFQGLRKYQEAIRPPPAPAAPIYAAAGATRLLRYGQAHGRAPVIFIPSLINPPQVLDISERRSLLRGMGAAGHDVYLVDWGSPDRQDATLDLAGHIVHRLLPLIASLPQPPILVGYCLGGSLAIGAASVVPVKAIATIAAPWDFEGFPPADRQQIAALWQPAKVTCAALGYVPMEVLQSGFWALDPDRTIAKYAAFLDMPPGSDKAHAFLAVEDWANAGPPLTFAAGADLFDNFYAGNAPGKGTWQVAGQSIDIAQLTCPGLSIRSSTDRIVPAAASPLLSETRTLALGHVGMVLGSHAPNLLWKPLSEWLTRQGG